MRFYKKKEKSANLMLSTQQKINQWNLENPGKNSIHNIQRINIHKINFPKIRPD